MKNAVEQIPRSPEQAGPGRMIESHYYKGHRFSLGRKECSGNSGDGYCMEMSR